MGQITPYCPLSCPTIEVFELEAQAVQALPLTALEDDCKLLGTLLDECLRNEVGAEFMAKVERIRSLAAAAKDLSQKNDQVQAAYLHNFIHLLPHDEPSTACFHLYILHGQFAGCERLQP